MIYLLFVPSSTFTVPIPRNLKYKSVVRLYGTLTLRINIVWLKNQLCILFNCSKYFYLDFNYTFVVIWHIPKYCLFFDTIIGSKKNRDRFRPFLDLNINTNTTIYDALNNWRDQPCFPLLYAERPRNLTSISEDSDEMPLNAVFLQGLYSLLQKKKSGSEIFWKCDQQL